MVGGIELFEINALQWLANGNLCYKFCLWNKLLNMLSHLAVSLKSQFDNLNPCQMDLNFC